MNKEEINTLTLKEYYMIIHDKTFQPYMNEKRQAFLITDKKLWDKEKIPETAPSQSSKFYQTEELLKLLYPLGFSSIVINNGEKEITINKTDIENDYYNPKLNANILLLRQSRKKEYLRNMGECNFIIPIKIDKRREKEAPIIHYAYATIPGKNECYYVIFSTLQEYKKWAEKINQNWEPLEININTLTRIRNQSPIVLNPLSDKLILPHDLLKKVSYYKKNNINHAANIKKKKKEG